MDIRFYRDYKHNYLVLDKGQEMTDMGNYQYGMLENNDIKGLIPFEKRYIDNKTSLFYEIDSKQSLFQRYADRKLSYEKLKRLLEDYINLCRNLEKYMLDEGKIVMNSQCIFEDLSSENFLFIYNPESDVSENSIFFARTILEYVDITDDKAAQLSYEICEMSRQGEGNIAHLLEKFLINENSFHEEEEINNAIVTDSCMEGDDYDFDKDESDEKEITDKVIRVRLPFRLSFIMSLLFMLVAGGLWYIRVFYYLTYEENLLDLATFMVCVCMSLICLIQGIKKKRSSKPEKTEIFEDDEDADDLADELNTKSYENIRKIPDEKTATKTDKKIDIKNNNEAYAKTYYTTDYENYDEYDDETMVLNLDFNNGHKLYGTGEMEGTNIEIQNRSVIVGKLSSAADFIINHPTVSRMHAQITGNKAGSAVFIKDLNSTNGTYVNGKRLLPNEKVILNYEDQVSFGTFTFAYR